MALPAALVTYNTNIDAAIAALNDYMDGVYTAQGGGPGGTIDLFFVPGLENLGGATPKFTIAAGAERIRAQVKATQADKVGDLSQKWVLDGVSFNGCPLFWKATNAAWETS